MSRRHHHAAPFMLRALFVRANAVRLLAGAVLAALVVLAGMALLGTSGWFISATALAGMGAGAAALNVFVPSALIRLLALVRTFVRYGERLLTHDATLGTSASLRERLLRAWMAKASAAALMRRPARVLFQLSADIEALESVYLRLAVPACAAGAACLFAAALLAAQNIWLGLGLMAWMLLCGCGSAVALAVAARMPAARRARTIERLRESVIVAVAGQTDLLMAGRLNAQCTQALANDAVLARIDARLHALDTSAAWALSVAGHAGVAATLAACGWLAAGHAMGAPAAALAILVALAAFEPFAAARRGALEAGRSWLAARRVAPRLEHGLPSRHVKAPDAPAVMVALRNATVAYDGRHIAPLRAINLRVMRGERIALIGASGSGKSTLLAAIAGELSPTAGGIEARPCCWLQQQVALFQDSLRDNLLLASPAATDAQLWEALRLAGLEQDIARLATGLDTRLGEGGLGLSTGQMRRLALARVLLHDAVLGAEGIWLLDEPTESLDAVTAADVLGRLATHTRGKTVLTACHLRREAAQAGRLLVLDGGSLVADLRRGTAGFDAALLGLRDV